MPGLFGIFSRERGRQQRQILSCKARNMADAMRHTPWLRTEIWGDDTFCGGIVHLGVLNPSTQPMALQNNQAQVWFDGEIYHSNADTGRVPSAQEVSEIIKDFGPKIAEIDGIFSLAFYDLQNQDLFLANDRLGSRPLYFAENEKWFAYASEVKALLAIFESLPDLDEISLRQFFGFGHMLGERTWWKDISLLPPASIWKITSNHRTTKQYWTFADISHNPKSEGEVLEELGQLWSRAISQRSKPGVMPLLLSGGLDSRLLMAELLSQGADLIAITFGSPECADMNIARRCAQIAGVPHRQLFLTAENWWHGREFAVWQTDGLISSRDLHVTIARDEMHIGNYLSPHNIAGDLIFGGSFIAEEKTEDWGSAPEKLLQRMYLSNPFFTRDEVVSVSLSDAKNYLHGSSEDCFHLLQRVRRFTINGPLTTSSYCESVFPSLSLSLIKLIYGSTSDDQRRHSRFYNRFLMLRFPKYYNNIPWQKTGYGLAESCSRKITRDINRIIKGGLRRTLKIKFKSPDVAFADYNYFVRFSNLIEYLLKEDLIADNFMKGSIKPLLLNMKLNSKSVSYALLAIMTFEIYLRQINNLSSLSAKFKK